MATIQGVYLALFGRPADPTGLSFFNSVTNNGANLSAIGNLATQPEYLNRFTGQSNVQIINSIYQSLFGRDADVTGLTFFANQLASSRQTINTIAINILDGATGSDLTTVNNKIAAANLFTASLDTGPEIVAYSGTAAGDAGRAFIAGVTTTVPTQAAVDLAVANLVSSVGTNPGTTYTLTTSVDNVPGTAGNDTINAYIDAAGATDTFTAADTINGGAGTDTLNITTDGNAAGALPGATINSVEVFKIREVGGTDGTYDFAAVTGETSVVNNVSTDNVIFNNIAAGASVTVTGDGATTNGNTTFKMTASTDAVTLNITGGTKAGNITRNDGGAATVVVNSTGAANTIGTLDLDTGTALKGLTINAATDLTASLAADYAASSTLTVAGAATKVDLSGAALSANFSKIDASGMTAGGVLVKVDQTDTTVDTQFIGGAGNDARCRQGRIQLHHSDGCWWQWYRHHQDVRSGRFDQHDCKVCYWL